MLETYTYEDIGEVSTVKNSGLQLAMHTGGRVVVTTNKAGESFKQCSNQFYVIYSKSLSNVIFGFKKKKSTCAKMRYGICSVK